MRNNLKHLKRKRLITMKINICLNKNKKIIKENERYEFLKAEFAHILELEKKGKLKKLMVKYGKSK